MKLGFTALISCCVGLSVAIQGLNRKTEQIGSFLRYQQIREMAEMKDSAFEKPTFCHDLDCPEFKSLNKTKDYEVREYVASRWVSTHLQDIAYDTAMGKMFMKLFNYIQGENEKKEKIAMTAPVIVRVVAGQGPACESNFTMSFFIAEKVNNPPAPSSKDVFLSSLPVQKVYVRSFSGRPGEKQWVEEGGALASALQKEKKEFEKYFYTAGYDSPFRLFNRHNEVWFVAKD